jgi:HupE / UreJ protein
VRRSLICGCFFLWTAAAHAHGPSDAFLDLDVRGGAIEGRWDVALRDLDLAVQLDGDDDGAITWGELRARESAVSAYALSRLHLSGDGAPCAGQVERIEVDRHGDGAYAVLRLRFACPRPPACLQIRYGLLFDLDPRHRGLLRLRSPAGERAAVLGPEAQRFDLRTEPPWREAASFVRDGIRHIWTGWDHLLFLLALLLPAVLRRGDARWEPEAGLGRVLARVAGVVTSFTAAHSITLALATLRAVQLPGRLTESAIALSVVVAALNNLFPLLRGRSWALGFGFGLLHGFGFATALATLELDRAALVRALFCFNLGVELGQLAAVAAFLTLAWVARRSAAYRPVAVLAGSAAIAAVAAAWLTERALDLRLPWLG